MVSDNKIVEALRNTVSVLYPSLPWSSHEESRKTLGGNEKMAPKLSFEVEEGIRQDKTGVEINVSYFDETTKNSSEETPATGRPVEVSGKQAELYKTILESLGYSTKREKFTVDSRGDSPELREELGKDYLDNRVILVSEAQLRDVFLLQNNPGYMAQMIQQIQKDLVKKITPHEALTGKVNVLYCQTSVTGLFDKDFKDYPCSTGGLHVNIVLDTLAESVRKINSLNNKIGFIKENSLKNLDKNMVDGILAEIHPLTTKYGSIESVRNSNIIDTPLSGSIHYFSHKGHDIFFFNSKNPFIVYNGEEIKAEALTSLRSSEKSKVIDLLVKNEFLKIEKDMIFANLESMAKSTLGIQAPESLNTEGFHLYKVFKKVKDRSEVMEYLKKSGWYLLRDACYGNIEFSSLPLELKEMITKPKDDVVKGYLKLLYGKTLKS